jgi:pimeloyl-ACP methyl ester carboxylesterase
MEGMAEVIKTILDTECPKVPPPTGGGDLCAASCGEEAMIGHSMGGYILLAFMEKYPNHLNAFGLFHSSAYPDTEEKKATRRKAIEFINQHGAFEFLKITLPNLFSPNSQSQIPNSIKELIDRGNNFSPTALISYYEAMMQRPDRTEVLKKAAVPVLFILGETDTAVPLQDGLKQCHLPEKSYIHILHQSGHMGMLEEANASNRILENFLTTF